MGGGCKKRRTNRSPLSCLQPPSMVYEPSSSSSARRRISATARMPELNGSIERVSLYSVTRQCIAVYIARSQQMTLPQKNRRQINVDGVEFHWTIGTRNDHRRGTATVQHASGSGARLIIDPVGILRSDDVAGGIRFAISHGWDPIASGPNFWVGFDDGCASLDRFVLRNESDEPYWKSAHKRFPPRQGH